MYWWRKSTSYVTAWQLISRCWKYDAAKDLWRGVLFHMLFHVFCIEGLSPSLMQQYLIGHQFFDIVMTSFMIKYMFRNDVWQERLLTCSGPSRLYLYVCHRICLDVTRPKSHCHSIIGNQINPFFSKKKLLLC